MRPAQHGRPERHLRLVRGLRVERVRRAGVGGAVGKAVASGELSGRDRRPRVLGRAERRRAAAHVDVRRERAVDDRRRRTDELRQRDPRERLRVLLDEGGGQRHGCHSSHQRERRDHRRLAVLGHRHQPVAHRLVETAGRVHGDDREHARVVDDLLERETARDRHHLDPVERAVAADREAVEGAIGVGHVRSVRVEVTRAGRELLRRGGLVADEMDDVEALRELHERHVVVEVPRPATTHAIMDGRRACDEPERDPVAPEIEAPRGVPGGHREPRGRGCERVLHDVHRDPNQSRRVVDERARPCERCSRRPAHELHADVLQQSQGGDVHGVELLRVEQRHRLEGVDGRRAGEGRRTPTALAPLCPFPPGSSRHIPILNLQLRLKYGVSGSQAQDPRIEAAAAPKAPPSGICPAGGGDQAARFRSCGIVLANGIRRRRAARPRT